MAKKTPDDSQRIGGRIRHLRRRHSMTQKELAEKIGMSVSYLNLLEHNRRKVTIPILLNLSEIFSVNMEELIEGEDQQLFSSLMALLGDDMFESLDITNVDVTDFARDMPHLAKAMLLLHDNLTGARRDLQTLSAHMPDSADIGRPIPEIISDFIQEKQNFFPELEEEAMRIRKVVNSYGVGTLLSNLERYLSDHCNVLIRPFRNEDDKRLWQIYDSKRSELRISSVMERTGQRFAMAYQIGLIKADSVIDMILQDAGFTSGGVQQLGRVALANYFAASVILPYDEFLQSAKDYRYDIELLQMHHRVSFEQVCHRLTTLNNPMNPGVPWHFLKVDAAGNIRKRFSLSGLPLPRHAGGCARWNIYDSFARPGAVHTQMSRLPNGATFLCIASAIRKGGRGFGASLSFVAIEIGCDIAHADEIVYGDSYDLTGSRRIRDVGITCRICEIQNCAERTTPAVHSGFSINEKIRGISPFMNSPAKNRRQA